MADHGKKRPSRLSATFVKTVSEPGRYGDGRGGYGLSLLVKPTTTGRLSKTWAQRIRIEGRDHNIGLGSYPLVSLALARSRAFENRQAVEEGRNPLLERANRTRPLLMHWRRSSRCTRARGSRVRSLKGSGALACATMPCPRLGSMRVDTITTSDVLDVMNPIWNDKRETARRVRHRIGAVMKWAVAQGHRGDNPAGEALAATLSRVEPVTKHHLCPALCAGRSCRGDYPGLACGAEHEARARVPGAHRDALRRGAQRALAGDRSFDLASLDHSRPTEPRRSQRHRVPLSPRAVEVLREAELIRDRSALVFPSVRGQGQSRTTP